MKLKQNFLGKGGGGDTKQKTFREGSIGYFLKLHITQNQTLLLGIMAICFIKLNPL